MNPTNLQEYKEKRKQKRIVSDLENIERLLTVVLRGLAKYKKYVPVSDIIKNVMENKAIVNLHLKKYNEKIKEKK